MEARYRRAIAGALIIAGLIQAFSVFLQDVSTYAVLVGLTGIGFAIAGLLFWFDG